MLGIIEIFAAILYFGTFITNSKLDDVTKFWGSILTLYITTSQKTRQKMGTKKKNYIIIFAHNPDCQKKYVSKS